MNKQNVKFILPPKNFFPTNGPSDPLLFYYRTIVGMLYRKRIQMGLDLLEPPYESILEFGHGSGLLLPTLSAITKKLYAIDIDSDPIIVNACLEKLKIKADATNKDLFERKYESENFDLIVAFSVFEHIKNPDDILNEFLRILKPNGKLLVGMPRVDKTMSKLFSLIGFDSIDDYHVANHKNFISVATEYFELKEIRRMPAFLPACVGLYYNMLFIKR